MYDHDYWARVREQREELEREHPKGMWLHSTDDDVPLCVHCQPDVAARCLVDGTHRRATDDDLARHRLHQNAASRVAAARAHKRGRRDIAVLE